MSDPTYTALRDYRQRLKAMLDDPECVDETFSLAVALLDYAVLRSSSERAWKFYADQVWGGRHYRQQVKDVIRKDIRRYDAIKDAEMSSPGRRCGAPLIRRQGPCGNSASRQAMLTDADTGRKQWLAGCARHHDWFDSEVRRNRAVIAEAVTVIRPTANTGGVLPRHLPEIDWRKVWLEIDPDWTAPPESEPEEISVAPKLTLILGGVS